MLPPSRCRIPKNARPAALRRTRGSCWENSVPSVSFRSSLRCEIAQTAAKGRARDHVALLKPLRERRTAPIFEPGFIESLTSGPPRLETFCGYSFAITMSNKLLGPSKRRCNARAFFEMKRRKAYEKPSERKTREKAEAVRRARKAARKLAQREGLIPLPKRREPALRRARLPRSF